MAPALSNWRKFAPIVVVLVALVLIVYNLQSGVRATTPTRPPEEGTPSAAPATGGSSARPASESGEVFLPLVVAAGTVGPVQPTATTTATRVPDGAATATATATRVPDGTATPTATPTAPEQGPVTTGWHQLGGNAQRTHFVEANLPAPTGGMENRNRDWRLLWIWNGPTASGGPAANHVRLPDSVAPVIGAGRLYLGDREGNVRAISAANGSEVWTQQVGGRILDVGAYDPVTQAVYFASTNGRLYKLRADNGAILGQLDTGSAIEGAVLLVGERAYVGNAAGRLIAVNLSDMSQAWSYNAGAALYASSAYSAAEGGLIIFPSEDSHVHAVRVADGSRAWRTQINSSPRPDPPPEASFADPENPRPERRFPDVYPVVAEQAGVVIVRSHFDWGLTWTPDGGAYSDQEQTRQYIVQNRRYESFFVLELATGQPRFTPPVLGGAMGNGAYYYSAPPAAVVRRLPDGSDVAYLLWRNRDVCRLSASNCDGREDTTFGEMDLATGRIRFIQDYKNEGTIRFPTDEQGPLTMVGNVLFHGHWMSLGSIRIPDRSIGGDRYENPIPSQEYLSVTNSMAGNECIQQRVREERFCPIGHTPPGDDETYMIGPGFYIYAHDQRVYDMYWHPPVRGPIFDEGVLYWRSSDGAIVALAPR